jgi:hypothetical protein
MKTFVLMKASDKLTREICARGISRGKIPAGHCCLTAVNIMRRARRAEGTVRAIRSLPIAGRI